MSNSEGTPEDIPGSAPPATDSAGMCADHPDLRAAFLCGVCGRAICTICAFTRNDGSRVCTQCANAAPAVEGDGPKLVGRAHLPPEHVRFLKCVQHPNVSAVQVCRLCGTPVCAICDFSLPNDVHICPRCVAAPPRKISKSRRGLVIAAFVIAAYSTLGLALFTSGALVVMLDPARDRAVIGVIFSLFLFFPALIGAALGISTIDRRLNNPASVWIAAIWNCLILGIYSILIIIGHIRSST